MAGEMVFPRYADSCRSFERGKILLCFICPKLSFKNKKEETWDFHVRGPQHLLVLESFCKSFHERQRSIICNICSKSFSKSNIMKHAIVHKLPPWHKPKNLFSQFLSNFIAQFENQYYCHVCKVQFSFWYLALKHIDDPKHQLHCKEKTNGEISSDLLIDDSRCKLFIMHSVFPKDSIKFNCMICSCMICGYKNFNEHINGNNHRMHEIKFKSELPKEQDAVVIKSNNRRKRRYRARGKKTVVNTKSSQSNSNQKNMAENAVTSKAKDKIISKLKNFPDTNSSSNNFSLLPRRKIEHPMRQFMGVVGTSDGDSTKRICPDCMEGVSGYVKLHVHSTKHIIEKRFPNKESEIKKMPLNAPITAVNISNDVNENPEKNYSKENSNTVFKSVTPLDVNGLAEKFATLQTSFSDKSATDAYLTAEEYKASVISALITSKLQYLENLTAKLDLKNVPSEEKPMIIDSPIMGNKLLEPFANSGSSPRSDLSMETRKYCSKIKSNISYYGTEYNYIYNIDNKQLHNIKLGLILCVIPDINHNENYCMICRKWVQNSIESMYEHLSSIWHNKYLKQMKQDHINLKTFPNTCSDLKLAIQFMEDKSDVSIKCHVCHEAIKNDINILLQHINNDSHQKKWVNLIENSQQLFKSLERRMFRDWYNVQSYWCVPCGLISINEIAFGKHLSKKNHEKNCQLYNNEDLIFDFCTTCATLWFGFQCTYSYHSQCKMHIYHLKDKFYYVSELPKKVLNLLSKPEDFCNELIMNMDSNLDDEKLKEEMLLSDLEKLAKEKFSQAKVYPFGSRITGLRSKNSDLDVFIDCNQMYRKGDSCEKKVMEYLQIIEWSLKDYPETWKIGRIITENVRIPIIKIHHKPTDIECDISFKNGLTAENTKLIKNYIAMFPLCRNLIIFMKQWISDCDLDGYNGINSYTIAWMIIYYLQYINILPSVAELIRLNGKSNIIAGWETGVVEQFNVQCPQVNFTQLLKGVFTFYSEFDYKCEVVCPLIGKSVNKQIFSIKPLVLPAAMDPYKKYCELDDIEPFCSNVPMCVQDPFELCHNLTKGVKKLTVHQFKTFCSKSAGIL